ncbi:MAG: hypothetical protein CMC04_07205 [Flavobacteriaceae bacterium]|nr:hypothetical protein [Flavobacteriaceae bacterium]
MGKKQKSVMNKYKNYPESLQNGPLKDLGRKLVNEINKIDKSIYGDVIKTWVTYYIFKAKENAFKKNEDPTKEILENFQKQIEFVNSFRKLNLDLFFTNHIEDKSRKNLEEIENETGSHYGNLFKNFDEDKYFNEAKKLLQIRLERNNIFPENLSSKTVLDSGCGGGRYSVAWKQLGAKKVVGVDFSETGIKNAKQRLKSVDLDVDYKIEDVVNLSFENDSFDIVFSNGVLHHTRDCKKGIQEIIRVLKKGGMGWLYLIENPGGYFWDVIEILRIIMKDVDNQLARESLKLLNVPTNRIFYILDHIMVPINLRLTHEEILKILIEGGATNIQRLNRGADFDRIEKLHTNAPFAEIKYGVGEHRYVFSK